MRVAAIMPCRGRETQTLAVVKRLVATAGQVDWRLTCIGAKTESNLLQYVSHMGVHTRCLLDRERLTYWQAMQYETEFYATYGAQAPQLICNLANDLLPGQHWLQRAVSLLLLAASLEQVVHHAQERLPTPLPLAGAFLLYWLGTVGLPAAFGAHPQFGHDLFYAPAAGLACCLATPTEKDRILQSARDALALLPMLPQADAVVTDPPYGETSLQWDVWPDGWPDVAALVAPQMWCFGSMRMFLDKRGDLGDWKLAQDIVWEKHNGSSFHDDRFRRVHEFALHFYRGDWNALHREVPRHGEEQRKQRIRRGKTPHLGTVGAEATIEGQRIMTSVIFAASGPRTSRTTRSTS